MIKSVMVDGAEALKLMVDGEVAWDRKHGRLPSEYQEVEWIGAVGGYAYIDTGIPADNDSLKIEMVWEYSKFGSYAQFFNSYVNESTNATRLILTNKDDDAGYFNLNTNAGAGTRVENLTKNTKHTTILDNSGIVHDLEFTPLRQYKGARNPKNVLIAPSSVTGMKLYEFRCYDGGTILRDYVPCYRKADNKTGLYDLIGGKFYVNTSGTIINGDNIN